MKNWKPLLVVLALVAVAPPTNLRGQLGPDYELFNYGRRWSAWSEIERLVYVFGFVDGQSGTYLTMSSYVPEAQRKDLAAKTFTQYEPEALRDVMTSLYADPANTYIDTGALLYIARDKLSGKSVESALQQARANSRGYIKKSP